jgi:Tol biopolymer transport system component
LRTIDRWIAYSQETDRFDSESVLRPADAKCPVVKNAQQHDNDRPPRFSPDGTLVAFTARRADSEASQGACSV